MFRKICRNAIATVILKLFNVIQRPNTVGAVTELEMKSKTQESLYSVLELQNLSAQSCKQLYLFDKSCLI